MFLATAVKAYRVHFELWFCSQRVNRRAKKVVDQGPTKPLRVAD